MIERVTSENRKYFIKYVIKEKNRVWKVIVDTTNKIINEMEP